MLPGNSYKLKSGRTVYANRGIIGINHKLELYEGYDGQLYEGDYTKDEQLEIAIIAIEHWFKFLVKLAQENK